MCFKVNDIVSGFEVKRVRQVDELQGVLYEMVHVRTKTELIWLDNKEKNKVFSISFKTIPENDTGVFHILEHSVLNGSEKYPVKEPFVDLLKGSMKTYLNAMTFPDKTMYPVSSCNEKDFQNLMCVYLDAVFAPAIYKNPNIFYQEGWHYEMASADEIPAYKGVVFNEMKGAFSSSQNVILSELQSMIFPDNGYRYVSGGDPKHIPDLSYDQFLETHKRFYHPSNAKIYLEGDMDFEKTLEIIADGYLNDSEYHDFIPYLAMQNAMDRCEHKIMYEIPDGDDPSDKTQIAFGKIIGDYTDPKRIFAARILCEYLAGSIEAPVKEQMLKSGLVQELSLMIYDGLMQPYLYGHIYNLTPENKDKVVTLLQDTLAQVIENGLNKDELAAIINQMEFLTKESREPKGLTRAIQAMSAWNYGGDPLTYLVCTETFNSLRRELNGNYFENLYKEMFCDWNHMLSVVAYPSKTVGNENVLREKERLETEKNSWSHEQIEDIVNLNRKLDEWQQSDDSEENKQKIPRLTLDDVERKPEYRYTKEYKQDGITVLYHKNQTGGILYFDLYFDLGAPAEELLPALGFVPNMYTNLPTEHYSIAELKRAIKKDIGALTFDIKAVSRVNDSQKAKLYLVCSCSVMEEKADQAVKLVREVLLYTKWESVENIASVWGQITQYFMQDIIMNGHLYAMRIAESRFSMEAKLNEHIAGVTCFQWLHQMMQNPTENAKIYESKVKPVLIDALCRNRMTLGVTAPKEFDISGFDLSFPMGSHAEGEYELCTGQNAIRSVLQIPAGISYGIQSVNLNESYIPAAGKFYVFSKIVSLEYLWNEVRVRGGAYGSGLKYSRDGSLSFYSFRDPDALRSLDIYGHTAEYIRSFLRQNENIEKFIIGTLADYEGLKSVKQWGQSCDNDYFRGITPEMRQKEKQQIIDCSRDDLLSCCDTLEQLIPGASTYVIGNEDIAVRCAKQSFWKEMLL